MLDLLFLVGTLFVMAVGGLWAASRAQRLQPVNAQLVDFGVEWDSPTEGRIHYDGVSIEVLTEYRDHHLQRMAFTWPVVRGTTLRLRAETIPLQLTEAESSVGDRRFDDLVFLGATDDAKALALLDDATRRAVRGAVEVGASFEDDRWQLSAWEVEADDLAGVLKKVTRAHRALRPIDDPDDLRQRLEARASADPVADIRLQALEVLVRRGLARDAFLARCEDDLQPAVRLVAATARGTAGRPTLEELLRRGSRTWRVKAAAALVDGGAPHDAAEAVLVEALVDPELADAAATALEAWGHAGLLPALGALLAEEGNGTPELRRVMATIRDRIDPSQAGALALADDGGQVSLASPPPQAGGLSEPADG